MNQHSFLMRVSRLIAVPLLSLWCGACSRAPNMMAAPPDVKNEVLLNTSQLQQMHVVTERVDLQDVDDTVLASGKVSYDDQKVAHVFSPLAGKVIKVFAQLGMQVKKGDPLITIESPDIGSTTSDVRKAQADFIAAEHDFQRQKELLSLHAASQRDFETAANNYRQAKAEMERAEQKARLFRQGDVVDQTYTLRSAISGEVFMKAAAPGIEVAGQYSGGSPPELFTIGETDEVWVIADVFELDIPRVKEGAEVIVDVVSWPDRDFNGRVDWVSGALDPTTHASKVRCSFHNRDGALKPEMYATVKISVDVRKALAIPRSAVLRLGDQTVVFVERGESADGRRRFERLPVIVDEGEGSQWLTVDHGLNRGDRIVTSSAILLSAML